MPDSAAAAAVTRATVAAAARAFERDFGAAPAGIAHAPGRVNLIGDHTDYNRGLALPLALEHGTAAAFGARDDGAVHCVSADLGESVVVGPGAFGGDDGGDGGDDGDRGGIGNPDSARRGWQDYLRGACIEWRAHLDRDGGMQFRGGKSRGRAGSESPPGMDFRGANLAIKTALPLGAGLSSSAAFVVAVLRALCAVGGVRWSAAAFAAVACAVENRHAGVQCGIMDPLIAAAARAGHALLIDCRSLRRRHIKLPANWRAVALDTATRRDLQTSDYNRRRAECEQAAAALGVASLREVSATQLRRARGSIDALLYRRARHVVTENARVRAVVDALAAVGAGGVADAGDAIGKLFAESQSSMTRDFEVGGDALAAMVAAARAHPACIAARQTGAGFAGCAVALVDANADPADFTAATARRYRDIIGRNDITDTDDRGDRDSTPAFYPTCGGPGAQVFPRSPRRAL
ncbi:MAG: galactokinase [Gammaproteobacteria bacterium]|nr:galactokinase [Gammaproteobacteria bacterium]